MTASSKLIATGSEWTFDHLTALHDAFARHAAKYRLDYYTNQMEVITSEQMLDAYASVGLPVNYAHWSFGKEFLRNEKAYKHGEQGLAYEIVINSDPCISYLMEGNSLAMQALVIAHACFGHNSFFKGNYLFKQWTQADAIIDYMLFARQFVMECEDKYGITKVEATLDALHALSNHGVDKYKRPGKLDSRRERVEQAKRLAAAQEAMRQSEYYSLVPAKEAGPAVDKQFPEQPEENLLYFIEKHSPKLEPWQRELARIVRKVAQYFYPQRQTQVMNEGWATFWHHRLLGDAFDAGEIDEGIMLECLRSHTNVVMQRPWQRMNPYALGFSMYKDMKRVCEKPDSEDREWFPDIAGKPWLEVLTGAMNNYRDESFIAQFLGPKVMREFKLAHLHTTELDDAWTVKATAGDEFFRGLRAKMAAGYRLDHYMPEISVVKYRRESDRGLVLRHQVYNRNTLEPSSAEKVLKHLRTLWGYSVTLEAVDEAGNQVQRLHLG